MRKITQQAISAFTNKRAFRSGNTEVRINENTELILHGHVIAKYIEGEGLFINLCGWNTNTTRERLNGLPCVRLNTKQGQVYLNGDPIDSNGWVKVETYK